MKRKPRTNWDTVDGKPIVFINNSRYIYWDYNQNEIWVHWTIPCDIYTTEDQPLRSSDFFSREAQSFIPELLQSVAIYLEKQKEVA